LSCDLLRYVLLRLVELLLPFAIASGLFEAEETGFLLLLLLTLDGWLSVPALVDASPAPLVDAAPVVTDVLGAFPELWPFMEALAALAFGAVLLAPEEEEEEADDSAWRLIFLLGIKNAGRWNNFRNLLMYLRVCFLAARLGPQRLSKQSFHHSFISFLTFSTSQDDESILCPSRIG